MNGSSTGGTGPDLTGYPNLVYAPAPMGRRRRVASNGASVEPRRRPCDTSSRSSTSPRSTGSRSHEAVDALATLEQRTDLNATSAARCGTEGRDIFAGSGAGTGRHDRVTEGTTLAAVSARASSAWLDPRGTIGGAAGASRPRPRSERRRGTTARLHRGRQLDGTAAIRRQ